MPSVPSTPDASNPAGALGSILARGMFGYLCFDREKLVQIRQARRAGTTLDQVVAATGSPYHFDLEGSLLEYLLCLLDFVTFKKFFEATIKLEQQISIGRVGHMLQKRGDTLNQRFQIVLLGVSVTSPQATKRLQQIQGQVGIVIVGEEPSFGYPIPLQSTRTHSFLQFRIKRTSASFNRPQGGRRYIHERAKFIDANRFNIRAEQSSELGQGSAFFLPTLLGSHWGNDCTDQLVESKHFAARG
jgi:hypothetical protein